MIESALYRKIVPEPIRVKIRQLRGIEDHEEVLNQYVPSGHLAIDVGANEGRWTRRLVKKFGIVYAVEPNKSLHHFLVDPKVQIVPKAAWNVPCFMDLYETSESGLSSLKVKQQIEAQHTNFHYHPERVECICLDSLRLKPDFIKIDVEFAELEVLQGSIIMLKIYHPVLLVECHSEKNKVACEGFLKRFDYTIQELRIGTNNQTWILAK